MDKPNAVSNNDFGELRATTPRDSPPPPSSDNDTYTEPDVPALGGMAGAEHNSPGTVGNC